MKNEQRTSLEQRIRGLQRWMYTQCNIKVDIIVITVCSSSSLQDVEDKHSTVDGEFSVSRMHRILW